MGDELRGESLVHLNVRFSTETELKAIQDMLYEKSGQGVSFTGLVEAMAHEVTIVTAIHNIKSNKGSKTAGVDKVKMDNYLQMPKDELILLIQSCFRKYQPKPARREYIPKSNGKMRPLGIPTVLFGPQGVNFHTEREYLSLQSLEQYLQELEAYLKVQYAAG